MWRALLPLAILTCVAIEATSHAQSQTKATPEPTAPAYLFRLERFLESENACVLVRGDGQYHGERHFRDKAEVYEGFLDATALRQLYQVLDNNDLLLLTQDKIPVPLITRKSTGLILSIARPGEWQTLNFPSEESREPVREELNVLVRLAETMRKQTTLKLSEEAGRNNCYPPGKLELKTRGSNRPATEAGPSDGTRKTSAARSFTLRASTLRMAGSKLEKSCLLILPSGGFRVERKSQSTGHAITGTVVQGWLDLSQMHELRVLLDVPDLKDAKTEEPPDGVPVREGRYDVIAIARGTEAQTLRFWSFAGGGGLHPGSRTSIASNRPKSLKPLQDWLHKNVETQGRPAPPNISANDCLFP